MSRRTPHAVPSSGDIAALVRQRYREFHEKTPAQRAAERAARGERKAGKHGAAALYQGVKIGRFHRCATVRDP